MYFSNRDFKAKLLLYLLVVTPGLLLMSEPARAAQTVTTHTNVSITANVSDFNAGEKVTSNHTIDWTSDIDWRIEVRSLSVDLGDSDDTFYTKPLTDFLWQLSSGGSWAAITTGFVTVKTGTVAPTAGSFDMDYKFLLGWALDLPGTYTANLEYQITSL